MTSFDYRDINTDEDAYTLEVMRTFLFLLNYDHPSLKWIKVALYAEYL